MYQSFKTGFTRFKNATLNTQTHANISKNYIY